MAEPSEAPRKKFADLRLFDERAAEAKKSQLSIRKMRVRMEVGACSSKVSKLALPRHR